MDVTAVLPDGRRKQHGVVAKRASSAEVLALGEIAAIPDTDAFLIDWGSARVGPIMLDAVMYDDWPPAAGLSAYLRAWVNATGSPLDPWQAEAGYAWATAFSNAMFVGAVARRIGPTQAETMLDQGEAALESFGQLLTEPRS